VIAFSQQITLKGTPRQRFLLRSTFRNFFLKFTNQYPMNFKHLLVISTLACVTTISAPSFAGDADFTLVNRTGYPIREVYIAPSKSSNWGKDRMGDGVLANARQKLFKFTDKASCKQDLQIVFDDDNSEVVWEGFDLCTIDKITLKYNRSTKEVSADVE
jgi:hypothetical protein